MTAWLSVLCADHRILFGNRTSGAWAELHGSVHAPRSCCRPL